MQLAALEERNGNSRTTFLDRLEHLADRIGPTEFNVLVSGEPGVGKNRLARRVYERSRRRGEPLITILAAEVCPGFLGNEVDELTLELNRALSRLGGPSRSTFRATLLIEEIGDLEPSSQNTLLQLTEERECARARGRTPRVDVRLMATTSVDLRELAERGLFRKDLLYRLNVGHLQVPPLRRRKAEISRLLMRILNKYSRHFSGASRIQLSPGHWQLLRGYSWPGNDAELEDFVKSLVGLRDAETAFELLQQKIRLERRVQHPLGSLQTLSRMARNRAERRMIEGVLRQTGGDCSRAAELLDISPNLLLDKIKELNISVEPTAPVVAELDRAAG